MTVMFMRSSVLSHALAPPQHTTPFWRLRLRGHADTARLAVVSSPAESRYVHQSTTGTMCAALAAAPPARGDRGRGAEQGAILLLCGHV
jgi:hypothetical protein